jgi:hypothetical protein
VDLHTWEKILFIFLLSAYPDLPAALFCHLITTVSQIAAQFLQGAILAIWRLSNYLQISL